MEMEESEVPSLRKVTVQLDFQHASSGSQPIRHYRHCHSEALVLTSPILSATSAEQSAFYALEVHTNVPSVPQQCVLLVFDHRCLVDDAVHAVRHFLLQTASPEHMAILNASPLSLVLHDGELGDGQEATRGQEATVLAGPLFLAEFVSPCGSWDDLEAPIAHLEPHTGVIPVESPMPSRRQSPSPPIEEVETLTPCLRQFTVLPYSDPRPSLADSSGRVLAVPQRSSVVPFAHILLDTTRSVGECLLASCRAIYGPEVSETEMMGYGLFCPRSEATVPHGSASPSPSAGGACLYTAGEWLTRDSQLSTALGHVPGQSLLLVRRVSCPLELAIVPLSSATSRPCTTAVHLDRGNVTCLLVHGQSLRVSQALARLKEGLLACCADDAHLQVVTDLFGPEIGLRTRSGLVLDVDEPLHVQMKESRLHSDVFLDQTGGEEAGGYDEEQEVVEQNYGSLSAGSSYPLPEELNEMDLAKEQEVMDAIARFQGSLTPNLLLGEVVRLSFSQCFCHMPTKGRTSGSIFITNYQLIFLSANRSTYFAKPADCYVPLPMISKVSEFGGENAVLGVLIQCKDVRQMMLGVSGTPAAMKKLLAAVKRSPATYSHFAFSSKEASLLAGAKQGWRVYDVAAEYERLGLTRENGWRLCAINHSYKLCPTYPAQFIVPATISDACLRKVADFRSKGRVPATVWRHPTNGATLTRCSQPSIGFIRRSRSTDDEKLVATLHQMNGNGGHPLYLLDSRPITNAKANHLRKGGHENMNCYPGCKLVFLNIENIHQVADSFQKLGTLCQTHKDDGVWLSALESTYWLQMISSVLRGAVQTVKLLHKQGISVLTHCSDGWDRTPQITAIAQFLLDPYYRTLAGFQVLIEKEWVSFGHRFSTRCGHGDHPEQVSPIFLVFLDCIWQVQQQYPCSVEFSESLLLLLFDHAYSCRFGTFLYDCERERQHAGVAARTASIWSYVDDQWRAGASLKNLFYRCNDEVLTPVPTMRRLGFWSACYQRYVAAGRVQETIEAVAAPHFRQVERMRQHLRDASEKERAETEGE